MNNPHLLRLGNGRKILVNVERVGEKRAAATWRGIRIYPESSRLTKLNADHILPYNA